MSQFLNKHSEEVAPLLLGWKVIREINGIKLSGKIVETEAYHQSDAASHSHRGQTARTEVMFGPAGRAYVYFTYGMHYCMNVVSGPVGEGSAVLIRALEHLEGTTVMMSNRGISDLQNLTNGPAKLCQALQIDKGCNGLNLFTKEKALYLEPPDDIVESEGIVTTTRIGISKDVHRAWRFYVKDNQFVSRK